MTTTLTEFINYYSPALVQMGAAMLLLGLGFFLSILAVYFTKWAFNYLTKGKYGRNNYH